jgi:putative PIN family toxin of toxin-antitoxin system
VRVVLDTNVLLSGLAYPAAAPGKIVAAWRSGSIEIVLTRFILDELARTLPRLGRRTGFAAPDIGDFIDALSIMAEVIEPDEGAVAAASGAGLRDMTDIPVLAAAIAAQADDLITGDKDLIALADRFPIVTPADFCARHSP